MTEEQRVRWLDAIIQRKLPGEAFKLAYWMSALAVKGEIINLSRYCDDGYGHRRTAQRSLGNLEWAKLLVRHNGYKDAGTYRYGVSRYTFLLDGEVIYTDRQEALVGRAA